MTQVVIFCVATPGYYADCAKELSRTFVEHCTFPMRFIILPGKVGPWPLGTISRPSIMLERWNEVGDADFVFCIDADMKAEAPITDEILGEITGVIHPGYIGKHRSTLPYDRNELSRAYVAMDEGSIYFCGGFFGGERESVRDLLETMAWICEPNAPTPRWHDEAALQRALIDSPPTVVLDPGYCDPEDDSAYRSWWPEQYVRKITAIDKPQSERGNR